ncbi:hypothetical protein YC2023_093759 [Brassica napus]
MILLIKRSQYLLSWIHHWLLHQHKQSDFSTSGLRIRSSTTEIATKFQRHEQITTRSGVIHPQEHQVTFHLPEMPTESEALNNLEKLDPSRPLSKNKHWVVAEIIKKARIYSPQAAAAAIAASASTSSASIADSTAPSSTS